MSLLIPKTISSDRRYPQKVSFTGNAKGHLKLHLGQFGLRAEEGN
jgi:hypothetical protein